LAVCMKPLRDWVGMKVILRFENYDRIEVFLDDQSKGFLRDLDQGVNSRIKRDSTGPVIPSASGVYDVK
jgi:hypothetical protein